MTEVGVWRPRNRIHRASTATSARSLGSVRVAPSLKSGLYLLMLGGLACLALLFASVTLPSVLGYPALTIRGGSMGDSLPKGSIAVTRWISAGDVRVGDVILVEDSGRMPKMHRVTLIEETAGRIFVQTKGDANGSPDPGLQPVDGRVAAHAYTVPYAGYLVDFVRTPVGWTVFVIFPAVLLSLLALRDIWLEDGQHGAGFAAVSSC